MCFIYIIKTKTFTPINVFCPLNLETWLRAWIHPCCRLPERFYFISHSTVALQSSCQTEKKLIQSIIFACTDHRRKQNSSMTSMGSKVLQHQFLMHNRSPTFYEVSGPATCDSNFTASCYISGQTAHIYRRHAPGLSRVQLRNTTHLKTRYRVQPVLARISATAVVPMQHLRYFELFQISNQWKPDPINFDKEQKVCKLAVEFSLKAALIREQNIPRSSSGFFQ